MKMLKMIAEISIAKLEDRKTVTAILHENGYTVGPGKRKKTETGKTIDYFLKVYREDGSDECDKIYHSRQAIRQAATESGKPGKV